MGISRDIQKRDPVVEQVIFRVEVALRIVQAAMTLFTPPRRNPIVEITGDSAINLVGIESVQACPQVVRFGPEAHNRGIAFTPVIGMTLPDSALNQIERLAIDLQPSKSRSELLVQDLFPDIGFGASRFEVRAMVIDILPLLNFCRHGATAMAARNEAGECEFQSVGAQVRSASMVEDSLNIVPGRL